MALKLKLEGGHAVLSEGRPVYIDDTDGKELAFDADQMHKKIAELNTEAKNHRLKAKELEETLAKFGDASPEEIEAFMDTMEELGGPDGIAELKKKGSVDVESLKKSMAEAYDAKNKSVIEAYETKLADATTTLSKKDQHIYKLMVSGQFGVSKFVNEKLLLPPDIAEATFGRHFKIEDDAVVAYLGENKILSRERPGENASFDEAIAVIVENYPMKDRILKGTNASGTGTGGNKSGDFGSIKTRADFRTDSEKAKFISDHGLDAFKGLPEK
jgi:hypothetical protein